MNMGNILAQNYGMVNQMNYLKMQLNGSNERLSTGKAQKAPADFFRASRLEADVRESRVQQVVIQDDMSFTQARDVALESLQEMTQRMKELSTEYRSGGTSFNERKAILQQADALVDEIDNVLLNSKYNERNLFPERTNPPSSSQLFTLQNKNMTTFLNSSTDATALMDEVSGYQATNGIKAEGLERQLRLVRATETIHANALSRIEDVDVAKETMNKAKVELLLNTNISLFADSLDFNRQMVLELLR